MSAQIYTTNPTFAAGVILLAAAWFHRRPAPLGWAGLIAVGLGFLCVAAALVGNFGTARGMPFRTLVRESQILAVVLLTPAAWLWHKGAHDALALISAAAAASFLLAPFVVRMGRSG